jgi:pepF/M3 family oligoendopeptidase
MQDSFPMWRRYFKAKARLLGKEQLAWWDLYAPLGKTSTTFSWEQARSFVLENFAGFSDDLAAMATRAFDENWIDAEQRTGKRGGAFCMRVRSVKQSRILSNFDGSLDQVSTLAHELGHAYHNECMFHAGRSPLNTRLPMTVAETASIMCESIIMNAVLAKATDPAEKLAILENKLAGEAQVVVDIYSRFLFESEVMERRAESELTAAELNDIMERSQEATYGDGLDPRFRQGWMWTWKPHYYYTHLDFYNYPYAFGLLFGTGLYALYEQQGDAFVPAYRALLADTGTDNAADLASRFGINLREKAFWANSLALIGRAVDEYEALAG